MKVSIVISAYNIENYIEKCLESIINQTYKELEIIVIDDGSKDNTWAKILKYKDRDSRIIALTQVNQGVQNARINGLALVTGEYFLIVDGDDYLEENCMEKLVNATNFGKYEIVYFNFNIIDEENIYPVVAGVDYNNNSKNDFLYDYLTADKMQNALFVKFIKKTYIENNKIKFINNAFVFAEDLLATIILSVCNPNVFYLQECLYNYVKRVGSSTNKLDKVLQVIDVFDYIENNYFEITKLKKYKEEYIYFKFRQVYLAYCISGKDYKMKKFFYSYWKRMNIDINENTMFKKNYDNLVGLIQEKLLYYNLNFELGALMDQYVFSNDDINSKRLQIINNDLTSNKINRINIYNNLYEKIFKLEHNDALKLYLKQNKIKNVILYGNLEFANYLNNKISDYEFVDKVYVADGYTTSDNIINIQNNRKVFDECDKLIVLPIHAYSRIRTSLLNQNITDTKIISIDNIL